MQAHDIQAATIDMPERLADFDPRGALAGNARQIWALLHDPAPGESFYHTYVDRTGLDRLISQDALLALNAEIHRYLKLKFTAFDQNGWAMSVRECIRHAHKQRISFRSILLALSAANERIVEHIWQAATVDDETRQRLVRTLLLMSTIELEMMCNFIADQRTREREHSRHHHYETNLRQQIDAEHVLAGETECEIGEPERQRRAEIGAHHIFAANGEHHRQVAGRAGIEQHRHDEP